MVPAAHAEDWVASTGTGCQVSAPGTAPGATYRWQGECVAGKAQGEGVFTSSHGGSLLGEFKDGGIREYEIHPEDFGLTMASGRSLRVDNVAQSKALLLAVLANESGPARDIVILNAGVALYAANVAPTILAGLTMAQQALADGSAKAKLAQLTQFTAQHAQA